MKLNEVIFIGGNWQRLASVRIRCVDLAEYLGCDYLANVKSIKEIPRSYRAYICVKPKLHLEELELLAERSVVIWDIIDRPPPESTSIRHFIASTAMVQRMFSHLGRVELIHHYHCNFSEVSNDPNVRRAGWVGHAEWYPDFGELEHDAYDVRGMNREEVAQCYRQIGIGLNLRSQRDRTFSHQLFSAGIKVINCIGFGIPSVSGFEPAYQELGDGCTIFSGFRECARLVRQLQTDDIFYREMREKCLAQANQFHIASVAKKYEEFIDSLK